MKKTTHVQKAIGTSIVVQLIELGARLQLLEHEFPYFSREALIDLYKEINGESPPKGMLPFSTDWFLTWQPNVHASLFLAYHEFFKRNTTLSSVEVLEKAYSFYMQEVSTYRNYDPRKQVLSITRAWTLIRLMSGTNSMLTTARCGQCGGNFVVENHKTKHFYDDFACGMCEPPARAGKTKKVEVCV